MGGREAPDVVVKPMTPARSLTLALLSALILFMAGLYVGSRPRTCAVVPSRVGPVPVCSNSFGVEVGV